MGIAIIGCTTVTTRFQRRQLIAHWKLMSINIVKFSPYSANGPNSAKRRIRSWNSAKILICWSLLLARKIIYICVITKCALSNIQLIKKIIWNQNALKHKIFIYNTTTKLLWVIWLMNFQPKSTFHFHIPNLLRGFCGIFAFHFFFCSFFCRRRCPTFVLFALFDGRVFVFFAFCFCISWIWSVCIVFVFFVAYNK